MALWGVFGGDLSELVGRSKHTDTTARQHILKETKQTKSVLLCAL